ncbi:D-isomer specific 2-hydroxyacid dehydrogenase [Obelidium mucronatum]|nr:D-isomer specific 2-hydroxyacid dehydrogenase [Obelidium mucronatum]
MTHALVNSVKVAVFGAMRYERPFLAAAAAAATRNLIGRGGPGGEDALGVAYFDVKLSAATAGLAAGSDAVALFVNDDAGAGVLRRLAAGGVRHVTLRSAGFNHVDVRTAAALGLAVTRVPEYSPHAIAEFAAALALAANRRIVPAASRVKQGNFALNGLVGFDMHGKTVGVVGTGKIGQCFIKIMLGFGCNVLCHDPFPSKEVASWENCKYVPLDTLFAQSRVISLHCPLTPETRYLINADSLSQMQDGTLLVNTSRGGLINTLDLIRAIKSRKIAGAGLDVYENETSMFFEG